MEFRHLGNGQYFPPIAPNGRVYAVPLGQETQVQIFCLAPVSPRLIGKPWAQRRTLRRCARSRQSEAVVETPHHIARCREHRTDRFSCSTARRLTQQPRRSR
ncbi:hypothetical protein DY943_32015 [Pseudomonas aeruginosa]|nr:hypothetical protein DY943_32015 [Pseudomonas aeruginosa]